MTRNALALRYAGVAIAACAWGTWPLILRHADSIATMPTSLTSAIVMAIMTAACGVALALERAPKERPVRSRRAWLGMAWIGFADAMNLALFFAAYRTTSVAVAVLTHYLTPILVAIAAPFALRERANARTSFAIAVSFAGLLLLLGPWNAERRPHDAIGAALGAGSAFFYASNVIVNKSISAAFRPTEIMFFHGLLSTLLIAAFVPREAWAAIDLHATAVVALGALGPGATAGLLFVWGLRDLRASHVSTLTLLEPLVAVMVGIFAFGERLTVGAMVGGSLILVGAAVVVWQRQLAK